MATVPATDRVLLERLIAFDTVSSKPNEAFIRWTADLLREGGAEVDVIPSQKDGKFCLLAQVGPNAQGGVVLAGHTDVVPTEGQAWSSDPFVLTERDGRLYGRGSADMKGFIACALSFVLAVHQEKLKKPVYIALTFDEESDLSGTQPLIDRIRQKSIAPDWLWLGEPTLMRAATTHKGMTAMETRITGVPVHSSHPEDGSNALYFAADLIAWIRDQAARRAAAPYKGSPFTPPYTTFNVGKASGGTTGNIVAGNASVLWEYRLHPSDDGAALQRAYHDFIDEKLRIVRDSFPDVFVDSRVLLDFPPFLPVANNAGLAFIESCSGQKGEESVSFGTEAPLYQTLGVPIVICGPGSIVQAHQPDEYLAVDQLALCSSYLKTLGERLAS